MADGCTFSSTIKKKLFCNHCNEFLAKATFYRHKRYYSNSSGTWNRGKTVTSNETSRSTVRGNQEAAESPFGNSQAEFEEGFDGESPVYHQVNDAPLPDDNTIRDENNEPDDINNYCSSDEDGSQSTNQEQDEESVNEPEIWEDVVLDAILQDITNDQPCPEPDPRRNSIQKVTTLVQWLVYFLLLWQSTCKVSDNGIAWLLEFLFQFLKVLSELCCSEYLTELVIIFPSSLYLLRKFVKFDRDNFTKYAVCPKCSKRYDLNECTEVNRHGIRVIKHCQHKKFPRARVCGSPLAKRVILTSGAEEFYPLKIYCYNSVINKLEDMLKRKDFPQQCEAWRTLQTQDGYLADVIDGQIWKDFQRFNGKEFLSAPRNYMFMLNFDFFQPKKHRTDYSVGVLYLANLNLPRSLRFKWENIIVVGIIPGLDKEPSSLNEFLGPFVKEMRALWSGVYLKSCLSHVPLRFRAALACVSCDIPAARKLCGFKGHNLHHGCSKCFKYFPGSVKESFDYSGFDRNRWPKRSMTSHRRNANLLNTAKTKTRHDSLSREHGLYYSALLELEYFDAIRFTVVDPMHNLFLGTAKMMFKLWMNEDILSKQNIQEVEKRIKEFDVGTGLGRIPHKMSANYGCYTASQWKNWTLVFSLFALNDLLPKEHLQCWQSFVLGCKFLARPVISLLDLDKADAMLLQFCKKFERLYGEHRVTPNMHLHGHLKECVLDYGPIYNFWCFSFERFNGILGSFKTNNRCIEIQLMRKLLADHFVSSTVLPKEFRDSFLSVVLRTVEQCSLIDFVELGPKLVKSALNADLHHVNWIDLEDYVTPPNVYKLMSLDSDDIRSLMSVYRAMYRENVLNCFKVCCSIC